MWHELIWRASVGICNVSVSREWDRHGRSVDAHVPVDHANVGLAQARPNNISKPSGLLALFPGFYHCPDLIAYSM